MLSMRTLLVVLTMGGPVGLFAHDTVDGRDGPVGGVDVASVQPADPAGRAVDDSAD